MTLHDALAGHAMDAVGVAVGKTAGGWAEGNFQAATTLFAHASQPYPLPIPCVGPNPWVRRGFGFKALIRSHLP